MAGPDSGTDAVVHLLREQRRRETMRRPERAAYAPSPKMTHTAVSGEWFSKW
ncbi:MAG: hypothetical protein ACKO5J_13925 [Rubrivivax sp.]